MTNYTTVLGDTWDKISYEQYGDYYISELLEANPDYIDTVIFSSGIELVIPDIDDSSDSEVPWR